MRRLGSFTALLASTALRFLLTAGLAAGLTAGLTHGLAAQEGAAELEARVWLDRGDEPVLRRGENVRVYYRTSEDAFAAIFRIDTDGRVSLLYPQHPGAVDVVRGRRDYQLIFPHAPTWLVNEDPGVGYLFIVASPEPLDFSSFPYDERHGWDVRTVGDVVYTDPYLAIDDYVARIVPDWEQVPYALDFVTYSVGETYSYPRFLCYDCHTYQTYSSWNPYDYTCSTFRVVIWDDPWFYPRYRYAGVNVVVAPRPVRAALPRYEVTRRAVGDAVRPIVRTRAAPARREVEYKEPGTAVAAGATFATARSRSTAAPASAPVRAAQLAPQERPQERPRPQEAPDTTRPRPTLQRRPSSRLPVRTPPSARPQDQPTAPQPSPSPSPSPPRPSSRSDVAPGRNLPAATARPTTRGSTSSPSTRSAPSASQRPVRAAPAPSSARPSTGSSRPQAAPSRPQAAPSRPQAAPARPQAAPSRPSGSSGATSRPSAGSQPARGAAPPRSSEPRPSARPRASDAR